MSSPQLLADENIAAWLVRELRNGGFDVLYVAECTGGITDDEVLELARRDDRLLLTEDKDFGDLVFRLKRRVAGVLLLRMPLSRRMEQGNRLRGVLDRYGENLLGRFTVVESEKIRFRSLPDPTLDGG